MGIALPGVQVGPWLGQEFAEGDAEHLGHGHDGFQRGLAGVSLPILPHSIRWYWYLDRPAS